MAWKPTVELVADLRTLENRATDIVLDKYEHYITQADVYREVAEEDEAGGLDASDIRKMQRGARIVATHQIPTIRALWREFFKKEG